MNQSLNNLIIEFNQKRKNGRNLFSKSILRCSPNHRATFWRGATQVLRGGAADSFMDSFTTIHATQLLADDDDVSPKKKDKKTNKAKTTTTTKALHTTEPIPNKKST